MLLYFSNTPVVPGSIDTEQWAAVQKFKERAKSWGIYHEYSGVTELVERARRHLLSTVRDQLDLPQVTEPTRTKSGARPVAREERRQLQKNDSKKGVRIENRSFLIIENKGTGDATNLMLNWLADDLEDDLDPLDTYGMSGRIPALVADGQIEFQLMLHSGTADRASLHLQWDDDGEARESKQTLAF